MNGYDVTPIERHYVNGIGYIYLKREDKFSVHGAIGAKARTADYLIRTAMLAGRTHFTTAGSRMSPQINICAQLCKAYGVQFTAHTPAGELSKEIQAAKEAGAEIIQHKAGYNSVIVARANQFGEKVGAYVIPFGMECLQGITQTAKQFKGVPEDVRRIVIPVGSGMNLAGLTVGIERMYNDNPPFTVLGIQVGKDPQKVLSRYASLFYKRYTTIWPSLHDYHKQITAILDGVLLDPIYEAKCAVYLHEGDLLWIVGIRSSI